MSTAAHNIRQMCVLAGLVFLWWRGQGIRKVSVWGKEKEKGEG